MSNFRQLRTISRKRNRVSFHSPSPHQSDTLIIPISVLPEPDLPGVYLPQGGLIQTTEDSDLVLEGLAIVERDGFYEEGEMEGEITPADLDAVDTAEEATAIGGPWPGEVRQRLVCAHPNHSTHVTCACELRCREISSLYIRAVREGSLGRFCHSSSPVPQEAIPLATSDHRPESQPDSIC